MSRLKVVNILSCLLPVGTGEEQVGENGIHDVNMRGSGVVSGDSSTPNVPDDAHGRESERSGSDGQGLGDSYWIWGKVEYGGECCVEECRRREVGTKDRKLPR